VSVLLFIVDDLNAAINMHLFIYLFKIDEGEVKECGRKEDEMKSKRE
jgi:hypothetical protein